MDKYLHLHIPKALIATPFHYDFGSYFLDCIGVILFVIIIVLMAGISHKFIEMSGQKIGKKILNKMQK